MKGNDRLVALINIPNIRHFASSFFCAVICSGEPNLIKIYFEKHETFYRDGIFFQLTITISYGEYVTRLS